MVLLLLGAVVQQQLGGPERVGHHHRHRGGAAARGELHDHRRMRERGEAQAAVFLRDDHAEEALVLDELPRFAAAGRRSSCVISQSSTMRAQLFDRAVEERLLFGAQRGLGYASSFFQSGLPLKSSPSHHTVPASSASLLGLRDRRQDAAENAEQRARARARGATGVGLRSERADREHDPQRHDQPPAASARST